MLTKKVVKYIQSLNHKKFRDEFNVFIAEGTKVVGELLISGKFIPQIICAHKDWLLENKELLKMVNPNDIFEVDEHWLSRISLLKNPNRVLSVFSQNDRGQYPSLTSNLTLMLDDIQDPGNMGTLIRIADWFGIENIICSEHSVECYNPKVVQATMGSLCRVNIFYTGLGPFLENHIKIPVYAAALNGESVFETSKIKEGFILIGNESKGIGESLLKRSNYKIKVPRFGHAESLNAAVAAGIIISHLKK